ncbi:MAG: DNA replication/repair protein RecF, partial [Acidimicrobiales bacterium]
LKSAASRGGRPDPDVVGTLDVWDAKLAAAGETLVAARAGLTAALAPATGDSYRGLAAASGTETRLEVGLDYQRSWEGPLAEALAAARGEDLRRGVTTVGPHRDDLHLTIGGLPARSHASQGEQRSLALALRLAGHRVVTARLETPPVLLLDDVFSELDADRAAALLERLPAGQALLTTAGALPPGAAPAVVVHVEAGKLVG